MIETSVIGGLLVFPEELPTALGCLSEDDFRSVSARKVWKAIVETECCDPSVLSEKTGIKVSDLCGWMDQAGLQSYFSRQCQELKRASKVGALTDMAREIMAGGKDLEDILSLVEKQVSRVVEGTQDTSQTLKEILPSLMKILEERWNNKGQILGTPTGFYDLDEITTGIHPGELWVVAGRPGMGKSAFGANVLESGGRHGKRGVLFSTEMRGTQVAERMLSGNSRVNMSRIRRGNFIDADWPRITKGMETMTSLPIKIDACPGITLQELKSRIMKLKRDGLDMVVLDYLQRMHIPGDHRSRAIGEVTRVLKDLALENDIAVVCLSQLSRKVEERTDKRPTMSDLRDSGEIEQDADVILFPYRESVYCQKCKDREEGHDMDSHQAKAELIIEKQRNGPAPALVNVMWFRELVQFENLVRG